MLVDRAFRRIRFERQRRLLHNRFIDVVVASLLRSGWEEPIAQVILSGPLRIDIWAHEVGRSSIIVSFFGPMVRGLPDEVIVVELANELSTGAPNPEIFLGGLAEEWVIQHPG